LNYFTWIGAPLFNFAKNIGTVLLYALCHIYNFYKLNYMSYNFEQIPEALQAGFSNVIEAAQHPVVTLSW
jgi:hypothetical protein